MFSKCMNWARNTIINGLNPVHYLADYMFHCIDYVHVQHGKKFTEANYKRGLFKKSISSVQRKAVMIALLKDYEFDIFCQI